MSKSSRHRVAVRSWWKASTNSPAHPANAEHHGLIAAAGGTLLVMVIAVLASILRAGGVRRC